MAIYKIQKYLCDLTVYLSHPSASTTINVRAGPVAIVGSGFVVLYAMLHAIHHLHNVYVVLLHAFTVFG